VKAIVVILTLVALAAIGGGSLLSARAFGCLENFPIGILDRPDQWNEYLQAIGGVFLALGGLVFILLIPLIHSAGQQIDGRDQMRRLITKRAFCGMATMRREKGQVLSEYLLILALIGIAAVGTLVVLGLIF